MRGRRVIAAVGAVVLALCAACSSTNDESLDATSGPTQQEVETPEATTTETPETPEGPDTPDAPDAEDGWIPGGEPLELKMTNPVGSKFEAVPGLTVTVPEGSVAEDTSTPQLKTITYRFPGGVDGVPTLQVASAGGAQASIYEETWVQEKAFATRPEMSEIHRSQEEWLGASEAVAFGWNQEISLQDGGTKSVEVLTLWLRDSAGRTFKLTAIAAEGELSDSPVYDALLSATLTAEN